MYFCKYFETEAEAVSLFDYLKKHGYKVAKSLKVGGVWGGFYCTEWVGDYWASRNWAESR